MSASAPAHPPSRPSIEPLDELYRRAGRPLAAVTLLPPEALPEPDRSLLVHGHDMTSTLEEFHGDGIHL